MSARCMRENSRLLGAHGNELPLVCCLRLLTANSMDKEGRIVPVAFLQGLRSPLTHPPSSAQTPACCSSPLPLSLEMNPCYCFCRRQSADLKPAGLIRIALGSRCKAFHLLWNRIIVSAKLLRNSNERNRGWDVVGVYGDTTAAAVVFLLADGKVWGAGCPSHLITRCQAFSVPLTWHGWTPPTQRSMAGAAPIDNCFRFSASHIWIKPRIIGRFCAPVFASCSVLQSQSPVSRLCSLCLSGSSWAASFQQGQMGAESSFLLQILLNKLPVWRTELSPRCPNASSLLCHQKKSPSFLFLTAPLG